MKDIIFHIDVNSAFLSWSAVWMLENGYQTDIREIPAIIGGDSAIRHGIVLAKSLPARSYGIITGEPVANARRKCPSLSVFPADHTLYKEKSEAMINYLKTLTEDIEQVSIDECFLYFTPIASKYHSFIQAANIIKDTIHQKFGFTVNVGISDKKVLAKMASDFQKPDRVHTLFQSEIKDKMWPLPVSDLFGCGQASLDTLKILEIETIGDLANTDPQILKSHLKSHGILLWEYANGIDDSVVKVTPNTAKVIGNSHTLSKDATTKEEAMRVLLSLSDSVSIRLRKAGMYASIVSVEIKDTSFHTVSHQCSLLAPSNTSKVIYDTACRLFDELWDHKPIRLLGIRTSKLTDVCEPVQMSLFDYMDLSSSKETSNSTKKSAKKQTDLEYALDLIREKYGKDAIVRASQLK